MSRLNRLTFVPCTFSRLGSRGFLKKGSPNQSELPASRNVSLVACRSSLQDQSRPLKSRGRRLVRKSAASTRSYFGGDEKENLARWKFLSDVDLPLDQIGASVSWHLCKSHYQQRHRVSRSSNHHHLVGRKENTRFEAAIDSQFPPSRMYGWRLQDSLFYTRASCDQ
jgi:hypothetical protein